MNISNDLVAHNDTLNRLTSLYETNRLPSTLLFTGQKSVGKYKTSLALSQKVLCENSNACGRCGSCIRVQKEQHESILILRPEKGVIKVDESRRVIKFLSQKLNKDEHKIVIVDGAECFNNQSANALLKTLEEPPENCIIILVAHSLYALLATIRSRCQIFRFGTLSKDQIKKIHSAEDWLIEFGQNNLQKIEELSDEAHQNIYLTLSESIEQLFEGRFFAAIKSIEAIVKTKSQCLVIIQALQLSIKTAFFQKKELTPLVLDWQKASINELEKLEEGQLLVLFSDSVNMEYEFNANFDILLSFESFYNKVIDFTKGSEAWKNG